MNKIEQIELQEIEAQMVPLRRKGMGEELVALGIGRSQLMSKKFGDK